VPIVRTVERPVANRSSWRDIWVLSVLVAVSAVLTLLASYAATRASHPTDEELTARFLSHESDFLALGSMLDSDCGRLPHGAEVCELGDLVPAGVGAARMGDYQALLARIGATNFHYFPRSGTLDLPVSRSGDNLTETRKSYLYLSRDEPQPLLRHQSYAWRGPGIYFVTGDHRIKGNWFIHHDGTVVIAFAAY
jgi:hypothetical protein